jgi:hypothetical protein
MGSGSINSVTSAQKIVARSSIESELFGVHDVLPDVMVGSLPRGSVHKVKATILYLDNMSSMRLEKNGMGSSSKRMRPILLRYYFVKKHIGNGTIEIVHCPTDQMWSV